MNKKIKVIELLNRISKGENPTFRKHGGTYKNSVWTFIISYFDKQMTHEEIVDMLNTEVEILEDEEKIAIQKIEFAGLKSFVDLDGKIDNVNLAYKYNELLLAVKQLDKKINKEE